MRAFQRVTLRIFDLPHHPRQGLTLVHFSAQLERF